jgi:hypothetical protein
MSVLDSVVFGTLAKALEKAFDRRGLDDGDSHSVEADIVGKVDGIPFSTRLAADMTVGHASTRASSVTPDSAETLAYVLGLVAMAYGDAVVEDILDDLLSAYKVNGKIPADPKYLGFVEILQSALRKEKQTSVAGAVSVRTTQAPTLSIAGVQ